MKRFYEAILKCCLPALQAVSYSVKLAKLGIGRENVRENEEKSILNIGYC